MITYKKEKNMTLDQLDTLYSSVGWISYTNNVSKLQKAVANSLFVLSAWDDKQLIGLIRTVGDGETILYIQDILVEPRYQNKDIGSSLMAQTLELFASVRQKVLLTEEAPDTRHFYEKFGFKSCDQGKTVAFFKAY